jgi:hypothetical protein
MMDAGIPWSLYTSLKNTPTTELALKGWDKGIKWPYRVNLSTTTKIQLELPDLGSPSMKSNDTVSQA